MLEGSWLELATLGPGDLIGEELWQLWKKERNEPPLLVWAAQVVALGDAQVYEIPKCVQLEEALKKGGKQKKKFGVLKPCSCA